MEGLCKINLSLIMMFLRVVPLILSELFKEILNSRLDDNDDYLARCRALVPVQVVALRLQGSLARAAWPMTTQSQPQLVRGNGDHASFKFPLNTTLFSYNTSPFSFTPELHTTCLRKQEQTR